MENKEFIKELLKIAYAAIVCDGDIDDLELEVIRTIEKQDFYFQEEDLSKEIDRLSKDASDNYVEFAYNAVKETYKLELAPSQKMIIINFAIAIVRADGKMQAKEISFIKSLIINLQLPNELVESINGNWWIIEHKD
jgi:uncharacterized tellurite resistance protein B-like protein